MENVGLLVRLTAKQGQEEKVAQFLRSAVELANAESQTPIWVAYRLSESSFGIFDIHRDEAGRKAHLAGEIAATIMKHADAWLSEAPRIEFHTVLSSKLNTHSP
jgi:quinol monooxygenase YgiN